MFVIQNHTTLSSRILKYQHLYRGNQVSPIPNFFWTIGTSPIFVEFIKFLFDNFLKIFNLFMLDWSNLKKIAKIWENMHLFHRIKDASNISHYVLRAKFTFCKISVHYLSAKSLSASYVIFMWRGKQTPFVSAFLVCCLRIFTESYNFHF